MLWIRLRTGPGFNGVPESVVSGSGFAIQIRRREKITHKHRGAKGFSCSFDIRNLQFLIRKRYKKIFACIFFYIFRPLIQLDPDPDPIEILDPDPDTQLCFEETKVYRKETYELSTKKESPPLHSV